MDEGLRHELKTRHVSMIALGGVIGGGLLVGSGTALNTIGPAAVISYGVGGLIVFLVMRLLAEMAATQPTSGSFSDYARNAFGSWAGFVSGWLYWYLWVVTIAFEAAVGAGVLRAWGLGLPLPVLGLALIAALALTNSFTVRAFGEFEFWFASIKIIAIVVFIVVGLGALLGIGRHGIASLGNLVDSGGFFPHGAGAVLSGLVGLIFAYGGVEVATIAAAESSDPQRSVRRVVVSLVWRIGIFYMGSVLALAMVIPWNRMPTDTSPFATAFGLLGLPGAKTIMDAVVLTAVLSVLNTTPRMLFALARKNDAPPLLGRTTRRGAPLPALLVSAAVAGMCIVTAEVAPVDVLYFLTTSVGAVIVINYLLITASHYRLRHRLGRDRVRLAAPAFPLINCRSCQERGDCFRDNALVSSYDVPPPLGESLSWRELWRSRCFAVLELVPDSSFSSLAQDRGLRLGIGQGPLEDLDARGALQPVAFAAGGNPHEWADVAPFEPRMTFREEESPRAWTAYAWDNHGRAHTSALYCEWQVLYAEMAADAPSAGIGLGALRAPAGERDGILSTWVKVLEAQESRC